MALYEYKVRDREGRVITSTMEADNEREVAMSLRQRGYFISEIKQAKTGLQRDVELPKWLSRGTSVKPKDVMVFSRQFATIINAGVPVVQSLQVLQTQTQNQAFKTVVKKIREDVETGIPLSDAMAKHPQLFDRLYIQLIRAGEASGNLDTILDRVAVHMEKEAAQRRKIRNAMTYPIIIFFIAIVVTWYLLVAVVPQFGAMILELGGEMPAMTRMVMGISDFVARFWWAILLAVIGVGVGIRLWHRTPNGRMAIDSSLLRMPIFGSLLQRRSIANFANTFGMLLRGGVNIIEAINITKGTANNALVESILERARESVERGEQLSATLHRYPQVFPPMVPSMLAIGEESGALDIMLLKIGDFYDAEVEESIAGLTTTIEPIMIVGVAVIVGFIVIAMFVPMMSVVGQLM